MFEDAFSIRRKLAAIVLSASIAIVALFVLLAAAPKADAAAYYSEFCVNVTLGPYGGASDNCAGGGYHRTFYVQVQAFEHSACASSTTNGAKSGVNASWVCTAGGGGEAVGNYVSSSVYTYGIIRNNTTGANNRATGVVGYESP